MKAIVFSKDAYIPISPPQKIEQIEFSLPSAVEIAKRSELQVYESKLYRLPERTPHVGGVLDPRLGVSGKTAICATCQQNLQDCVGHFGYIRLQLPLFHIGYLSYTIKILQVICKTCSRVLLAPTEREEFLRKLRNPKTEELAKKAIFKKIHAKCKSAGSQVRYCPFCGNENAVVKKAGGVYKIMHEKFKNKAQELEKTEFADAVFYNEAIKKFLSKVTDDLNPLRVLHLFQNIPEEDLDLLCLGCRPENLIVTCLPVPPLCIRPSVDMEGAGSNEDDISIKLTQILDSNTRLKAGFEQGMVITGIIELWDAMQNELAVVINSDLPGLSPVLQPQRKVRGYVQRLKGKAGRFRGNLSGKRVDFSGRTVISPDPNLGIDELAVPLHIAKTLTYPEQVNVHNLNHLQQKVLNGQFVHPGANWVIKSDGAKFTLRFADRRKIARELQPGDIVERHLRDGDIVLFNRQPSLHRVSMMAHKVKVRPWRTLRFNECVCSPYNADFDGDEMNLHLPQTEEARAEALMLMSTVSNLCTPKNGELLVCATQDFLTCAYLITSKDVYFTRAQFSLYCSYMSHAQETIDLPQPALLKPMELWTGKQLLNVLIRPHVKCKVFVNFEIKEKFYSKWNKQLCPHDGYVHFHNSELISGRLGKVTLGGKQGGLFGVLKNDFGGKVAAEVMNRLARLSARYMGDRGFSIGLEDVTPSNWLQDQNEQKIKTSYKECEEFIEQFHRGGLTADAGMNEEETLEARVTGVLNNIRSDAGKLCMKSLHYHNSSLIMSLCGAKGSPINIAQMIACVGQQMVNGTRAPNGFTGRSLPHFPKGDKTPQAKGFVANSFYSGLTPTEFFFHTMAGREGLVDTAVKTAETGYMSRRLIKALEDLYVHYDLTVRDASSSVVQLRYGDDALDPPTMEGKEGEPIDFYRLLNRVTSLSRQWDSMYHKTSQCRTPLPGDLTEIIESVLDLPDNTMESKETQSVGCSVSDQFKDQLDLFLRSKLDSYKQSRQRLGLSEDDYGNERLEYLASLDGLTSKEVYRFQQRLLRNYERKLIDPGSTVGAIAAQSIGEPGTQMTLKTFHFAGVSSMQVTQGVPRIKEIINASKKISTPFINVSLECDDNPLFALIVKSRIEKTKLGQVAKSMKTIRTLDMFLIEIELDLELVCEFQLDVNAHTVKQSILQDPKLKIKPGAVIVESESKLSVCLLEPDDAPKDHSLTLELQRLEKALPEIMAAGLSSVERAVIQKTKLHGKETFKILAEGTNLLEVMCVPGVLGSETLTNHVMEIERVLGIEAARSKIISEIESTMNAFGMFVDRRHTMLLADCMTYKGEVLGITRTGISKMKDSVLHAASFEKTADHLFDAALHGRVDNVSGVSESIIMGIPMPTGTGMFKLLYHDDNLDNNKLNPRNNPIFSKS